jgi:SAM-dependent methyltransferase
MNQTSFYDQQSQKYSPSKTIKLHRHGLKKLFSFDDRFLAVVNKLAEQIQNFNQKKPCPPKPSWPPKLQQRRRRRRIKILDVGCGDGFYEKELLKQGIKNCQFYGVDLSPKQLQKVKKIFYQTNQLNIDSQKLPFPNNFFDMVILSEILEHLLYPQPALNEAQRVLKKGGLLFLTVPNVAALQIRFSLFFTGCSPLINYPQNEQHIRFFTIKDIEKLISMKKIYQTGVGSLFFDRWNFPFRLPTPRFLQIFINRFFPNLSLGLLFVFQKT